MSKLKQARERAGLSLQELADKVGTAKGYIWQLENKDNPQPRAGLAWRIHVALGIPFDQIFDVEYHGE